LIGRILIFNSKSSISNA